MSCPRQGPQRSFGWHVRRRWCIWTVSTPIQSIDMFLISVQPFEYYPSRRLLPPYWWFWFIHRRFGYGWRRVSWSWWMDQEIYQDYCKGLFPCLYQHIVRLLKPALLDGQVQFWSCNSWICRELLEFGANPCFLKVLEANLLKSIALPLAVLLSTSYI